MFLDALVGDAAWRCKYAVSREGAALPWALVAEDVTAKHPYEVFALRGMLAVPYFEKALYELDEAELSAAAVLKLADAIEEQIQGGFGARPLRPRGYLPLNRIVSVLLSEIADTRSRSPSPSRSATCTSSSTRWTGRSLRLPPLRSRGPGQRC